MNIRELAALANVSPATVSLVLNNKTGVGSTTREYVLKLAEENNYRIPAPAKQKNILFLKYIKHGLIVEENAGFISTIIDSIENDCRAQGYSLSIVVSEHSLESTLLNINYTNFHGIIFLGTELDENSYPLLDRIPIPYIVIDNIMPHFHCSSIAIDNHEIVYDALSHLKELGHKEIGYFKSNISIQNFLERSESFYQNANRFGFTFHLENQFCIPPTLLGAFQATTEYLKVHPKLPSCAFADNDTIAIGVIKALKKSGYRVPEDISIIGFDDIPFAAINSPTLSTMSVPKKAMGSLALQSLHDMIINHRNIIQKTRVGGMLVPRHSTSNHS
ncbi:MAG: LacI family DNA-binding transcriptional regulator [Lachnospiraceae bacterium]